MSVCGRAGSVCPLLVVAGTTFFCFTLTDGSHTLPVLIKVGNTVQFTQLCLRVSMTTVGDGEVSFSAGQQQVVVVSVCVCRTECVCDGSACVCPARLERKQHPVCD